MYIICLSDEEVEAYRILNENCGKALSALILAKTPAQTQMAMTHCDKTTSDAAGMFAALAARIEEAPAYVKRWKAYQKARQRGRK